MLDWLATEFMQNGWSMKKIKRLMVTSATYRQSSRATPELIARDPYNKLYARGPRFRVEARNGSRHCAFGKRTPQLDKMFGPSVMPYQPDGIWDVPYSSDKWVTSEGEDHYRRSIYTFMRRSAPYPSLVTFDAPSREFCTVRRVRTNTPLQALTTLNDPYFFDAARAMAKRHGERGRHDAESTALRTAFGCPYRAYRRKASSIACSISTINSWNFTSRTPARPQSLSQTDCWRTCAGACRLDHGGKCPAEHG